MPPGIGYGDQSLLYSASQYEPYENPTLRASLYTGGMLGMSALAIKAMGSEYGSGSYFDRVRNVGRAIGYSSPGALLNTFRPAEFMSPFATPSGLDLPEVEDGVYKYIFNEEISASGERHGGYNIYRGGKGMGGFEGNQLKFLFKFIR